MVSKKASDLMPGTSVSPTVVDPHSVPVQFVDWIVTSGIGPAPGLINIDLAALDYAIEGPNKQPQAILQSRLRMSVLTARDIVGVLTQMIEAMAPPAADQSVN